MSDSYDNALAEMVIGLYKTELIHHEGSWHGIDQVEYQTLEWVDWFNKVRLLEPIADIPPIEFKNLYYRREEVPAMVVVTHKTNIRGNRGGSLAKDGAHA